MDDGRDPLLLLEETARSGKAPTRETLLAAQEWLHRVRRTAPADLVRARDVYGIIRFAYSEAQAAERERDRIEAHSRRLPIPSPEIAIDPGWLAASLAETRLVYGDRDATALTDADYYSFGGRPSLAEAEFKLKVQQADGWRARPDLPPWPIVEPFPWNADPFEDKNWVAQLHGWRPMDVHIRHFGATGNAEDLRPIVPWMLRWGEYRKSLGAEKNHRIDPPAGMRATRIALIVDAIRTGRLELPHTEQAAMLALATSHVQWLATPEHTPFMNHAYFQLLGLELLCRVLDGAPWASRVLAYAGYALDEFVRTQFTPEGVHVENSPSYHNYALEHLVGSGLLPRLASQEIQRIVEDSQQVLPWLVFPDGHYADIGDSGGPGSPLSRIPDADRVELCGSPYGVSPFWRSGYVVVRSAPDAPAEQASTLLLVGAAHTHIHSHADKLSFELLEFGRRVIVDTGKYGYIRDPMRTYAESAAAHNTVGLANYDISRLAVTVGKTRLEEPIILDDAVILSGQTEWVRGKYARFAFKHRREMTYQPGRRLSIVDLLSSDEELPYASRLHFARSINLIQTGPAAFEADLGSERRMTVRLVAPRGSDVRLCRGSMDPLRGWRSVAYLKMEPICTVEAVHHGGDLRMVWIIEFTEA